MIFKDVNCDVLTQKDSIVLLLHTWSDVYMDSTLRYNGVVKEI